MTTNRKQLTVDGITLWTTDNRKHHHLINKVKNAIIKAPYHQRVRANYIIQVPKTQKFVLFQSYDEDIDPTLKEKHMKRLNNVLARKSFKDLLKNEEKQPVWRHNITLNNYLKKHLRDRTEIKIFNKFNELKDTGQIISQIEGLNGSTLYIDSNFENYLNKVDYDDETVKLTVMVFRKVRTLISNILNVFNDREKIKQLILNQDTVIPIVSPTNEKEQLSSMKGEIESRVERVDFEVKQLFNLNSISNLLPNTFFQKANLFIQIFKSFETIETKEAMIDWLQTNFNVAKSIYIEMNQTRLNTLQEKTLQKIIKEVQ